MIEEFRTYHDAGRSVEQRQVFCGGLSETTTKRSHDDRGFVLEEKTYDGGKLSSRARFTREFDGHGNWTKQIMVRGPRGCDASGACDMQSEGTFVTYRTIQYGTRSE